MCVGIGQLQVVSQREGWGGLPVDHPVLGPALRLHWPEWHGGITLGLRVGCKPGSWTPHAKSPRAGRLLAGGKQMVDGRHHGGAGSVVGTQHMVAPGGGTARLEVALDVGPAKGVDGLLGVTNQQQGQRRVVGLHAVQAVEQAHLQGRGVLKFVDQRSRVSGDDALTQPLAAVRVVERRVQALGQIGKAKLAALRLELRQPGLHVVQRVGAGHRAQSGHGGQVGIQLGHVLQGLGHGCGEAERRLVGLAGLRQAIRCEAVAGRFCHVRCVCPGLALGPIDQVLRPTHHIAGGKLAAIPSGFVGRGLISHPLGERGKRGGTSSLQFGQRLLAQACGVGQHLGQTECMQILRCARWAGQGDGRLNQPGHVFEQGVHRLKRC